MTLKIAIENVQAISAAEIEVEGFTAVVGRSNAGKSSIIRGMAAALSNKSPKSLFRRGTKQSSVSLDDESRDIHLKWEKGSSINKYTLNGEVHTKVGKEVPPKVQEWGFKDVKVNDDTLEVQFAKQHRYLFLLDKSGGFIADFISKITKVDVLSGSLKDCESDLREASDNIKSTEAGLEQLVLDVTKFEHLDTCGIKVGEIFEARKDIVKRKKITDELTKDCEILDKMKATVVIMKTVPSTPEMAYDVPGLKQLVGWVDEVDEVKKEYIALRNLQTVLIPEMSVDFSILKVIESYLVLESRANVALPAIDTLDIEWGGIREADQFVGKAAELEQQILEIDRLIRDAHDTVTMSTAELDDITNKLGGVCPFCKNKLKHANGGCGNEDTARGGLSSL